MSGHGGFSRVGGGGGAVFKKEKSELAKELVEEQGLKYKRESEREIRNFMQKAAETKNGITVNDEGEIVTKKSIERAADQLAEKLIDRIEFIDRDIQGKYETLRDSLKNHKYYIDPKERSEIDKFRDYQRNSQVEVVSSHLVKDKKTGRMIHPTSLDSKYEELYNDGKNQWGLTNPNGAAAKLVELNDTLRNLRSQMKYGINDPRALAETGGATRSQFKQGIKERLIENAGIAQEFYNSPTKTNHRRKKK